HGRGPRGGEGARGDRGAAAHARGGLPRAARGGAGGMRMFLHQLKTEQLLYWRSRESAVFTFIFPLLLFVLLASVYSGTYAFPPYYGKPAPQILLAALLAYGCAMVS